MADKTIRWQVDGTNVLRAQNEISQNEEKANLRKRSYSKEEISDIEKQIKLIKEKLRLEEEVARKKILSREQDIRYAEQLNRQEILDRRSQAEGMTGDARSKFNRETSRIELEGNRELSKEKLQLLDQKNAFNDLKETNKKQLEELKGIGDSLDKGSKGSSGAAFGNIAQIATSGNLSSMITGAGIMAGVGGYATAIATGIMIARNYESGEQAFRVATQKSKGSYESEFGKSALLNTMGIGLSDYFNSTSGFIRARGGNLSDRSERYLAAGVSRGISDEQLQGLLKTERYGGGYAMQAMSAFETYLKSSGKSLVQLPEILSSYLNIANSILSKTGRVDSLAIQTMMMSVGKSYGVEGTNLDRLTSSIMGVTGKSQNPLLRSMQLETARSLNPNASMWELEGMLQNPEKYPEYQKKLLDRYKNIGGGGDYSKFALESMGFAYEDVNRVTSKEFQITKPTKLDGQQIANIGGEYIKSAQEVVGGINSLIPTLKDGVLQIGKFLEKLPSQIDIWAEHKDSLTQNTRSVKELSEEYKKKTRRGGAN